MTDPAWKRFERRWAERIGGTRIPTNGRGALDVDHPVWASECKYRKSLPAWLTKAFRQCKAASEGRLPVVPILLAGQDDEIVLMPGSAFRYMARKAGLLDEGREACAGPVK